MSSKILLAEDSQTIQKVIKITLASEDYKLELANSEDEMNSFLEKDSFDLVLIDFGLSETLTGYELAELARTKSADSKIILLFGTFDTIDENMISSSGVDDKIVKPFDSSNFINIIQRNLEGGEPAKTNLENKEEPIETNEDWVVSDTGNSTSLPMEEPKSLSLEEQVSDWAVGVPPVIGKDSASGSMDFGDNIPPVIDEKDTADITQSIAIPEEFQKKRSSDDDTELDLDESEEASLPPQEDLEYPSIEDIKNKVIAEEESENLKNELSPVVDIPPQVSVPKEAESVEEVSAKVEAIESEISEEEDPESFWALDTTEVETEVETVDEDFKEPVEILSESIEEPVAPSIPSQIMLSDEQLAQVVEMLKPFVSEKIQEFCKESIDRTSWEVIPDLAENIISKEIQALKEKTLQG